MELYDQIQALRAELSRCGDAQERAQIGAELSAAQGEQARQDAAYAAWLAADG